MHEAAKQHGSANLLVTAAPEHNTNLEVVHESPKQHVYANLLGTAAPEPNANREVVHEAAQRHGYANLLVTTAPEQDVNHEVMHEPVKQLGIAHLSSSAPQGVRTNQISKRIGQTNKILGKGQSITFMEVSGALNAMGEQAAIMLLDELELKCDGIRDPTRWIAAEAARVNPDDVQVRDRKMKQLQALSEHFKSMET